MSVVRTACNRDCPDACSILAHVEAGRVVRLQGDPAHPVTQGFLCYRTDQFLARQYSPERLTTPLIRRGGSLQPASWDEALDLCAATLARVRDESGPAAIFHYRSGGSLGLVKHVTDFFFAQLGAITGKRGDICGGAGDAAQLMDFGDADANDVHDLLNARAAVVWGKNAHVSGPHLLPILRELKKRGGRVALVDPVRHKGASLADLYVQPRPGGDAALALGMARVMFERGWIPEEARAWCDGLDGFRALAMSRALAEWARLADVRAHEVEALAALYGEEAPAAILVGWGMQRRRNGATIVRCLDALGAARGNVGVAGGGVAYYYKRRGAFDTSMLQGPPPSRTVCEITFGHDLLAMRDPPVRAVWITAGNPVAMLPDSHMTQKALRATEFVVVVDSFLTDTAREATVVLPHATLLEDDDLVGAYGHHYLGSVRPVVPAPDGVKTDLEISQALADRMGFGERLAGSAEEWKRRMLARAGVSLDDVAAGYVRSPASPRVAFEGRRFPTATGRANLITEVPEARLDPPRDPSYPLVLQALSTPRSQSSQWSPAEPEGPVTATVHPDAAPGFRDGDEVLLRTALGAMRARLVFDPGQRRDVVLVPKGGSLHRGRAANAITRAALTDDGEGAALYEEGVRIEATESAPPR